VGMHLRRDLEELKKDLLLLGAKVEDSINKSILALTTRREELAKEIIDGDAEIDAKEVELEEDCLKILALHQPVAADLRFIITALKVNNDLERMGDLAVNIAERAVFLAGHKPIDVPIDFTRMTEGVLKMVRDSLDSLVKKDPSLAREVLTLDDEIDDINRGMHKILQDVMCNDPESTQRAVHLLSTSRHLERVADLATNIAEDVVFMVEGELIRHGRDPKLDKNTR
jgi:phosphate transport system protein